MQETISIITQLLISIIILILFYSTACNCNGYSNKCFFDRHLYNLTGHGGHCMDCQANRDGPNCERCKENFYLRSDGYCINCACDAVGEYLRITISLTNTETYSKRNLNNRFQVTSMQLRR